MGHFFRSDNALPRKSFVWSELCESQKRDLEQRAKALDIEHIAVDSQTALSALNEHLKSPNADQHQKGFRAEKVNFVHFARPTESARFIVDNFPILAKALYLARENRKKPLSKNFIKQCTDCVGTAYEDLARERNYSWFATEPPDCNRAYLESRARFNHAVLSQIHNVLLETEPELAGDEFDFATARDLSESPGEDERREIESIRGNLHKYANHLFGRFKPEPNTVDAEDWHQFDQALSGNRFCLTILLSAAEQIVLTKHDFVLGGDAANEMLGSVVSALRNASQGQREETVMASVMSVYRQIGMLSNPDLDHNLHQLLLRNIAVLGCPVSPNVLVRLPDIREYFNGISFKGHLSRRRMVARALAALAERGLVFRISPHPKHLRLQDYVNYYKSYEWQEDNDLRSATINSPGREEAGNRAEYYERLKSAFDDWPAKHEYRYALHRQIQTYRFQRLGHLTAPPVTANNFAPTLYASMPSRVVRLSTEAYLFLRRLLLGLSQYPDIRHDDSARLIPVFGDDDPITRVQALRAALSLARTCFSIAAVSRFDRDGTGLDFIRKRGHFETYRVRLRWILRKAWEVHEPRMRLDKAENKTPPDTNQRRVNALYVDEIVWLYNEVAVTCLVQGALVEAIGHARQAIYLNRRIEQPVQGGRMHNMLSLNTAIIQLERGRLRSAETRLNAIVASEEKYKPRLANLAKGYLALISQLRGRRNEAEDRMIRVVEKLETENQDRALSVILHHLGRLVARTDLERAKTYMNRALDYAEKGGHEDIRYRILVSEVWISQVFADTPQDRMKRDRAKLREAEQYAKSMGLHSLLVESLHAQGLILLEAGDFSSSGRLMTKAMAIARRNDMTLRLNAIMTNYARVLLARRRIESAKRLLSAALALAKRCGYSIEVVRIHEVMDKAENQSPLEDEL